MEENEIYTESNDTFEDDVIECNDATTDYDESATGGVAALAGLVGLGVAGGIAIHKWVVPAVRKGADKAKKKIVEICTKKDEHYVITDGKDEEVKESETKDSQK